MFHCHYSTRVPLDSSASCFIDSSEFPNAGLPVLHSIKEHYMSCPSGRFFTHISHFGSIGHTWILSSSISLVQNMISSWILSSLGPLTSFCSMVLQCLPLLYTHYDMYLQFNICLCYIIWLTSVLATWKKWLYLVLFIIIFHKSKIVPDIICIQSHILNKRMNK